MKTITSNTNHEKASCITTDPASTPKGVLRCAALASDDTGSPAMPDGARCSCGTPAAKRGRNPTQARTHSD